MGLNFAIMTTLAVSCLASCCFFILKAAMGRIKQDIILNNEV